MSDKKLLNESTIRRFMKLANVDTMTDNFISEMGAAYKKHEKPEDQNEAVEEEEVVEEEIELTNEEEEDMPEDDMADDDMGDDMEMDAEMGDMDMADDGDADISLTEEEAQLLIDLGSRLEAAMGDAGEDDMGDMDDEPMDDMADEPIDDMGAEEEPADDEMMQEDIVNEVLKRVTQRIIREKMKRK